jgi:hypothetical protein
MRAARPIVLLIALFVFALAGVAQAATYNPRKIKKWPDEDKVLTRAFSAWMSQEEMDVFIGLESSKERQDFLDKAGYWQLWKEVDHGKREDEPKMMPHVIAGDVVRGMTKNEVFMCWGKPKKIRKDFKKSAYVDVLNFAFERDRKGNEFLSLPNSQTAYKNEIFTKLVYMYNGYVFSIVTEGEEENVMDELPIEEDAGEPEPEDLDSDKPVDESIELKEKLGEELDAIDLDSPDDESEDID